jgi:hypothetical protein
MPKARQGVRDDPSKDCPCNAVLTELIDPDLGVSVVPYFGGVFVESIAPFS